MRKPIIRNPQTWTRIARLDLRRLANDIGNEAMYLSGRWPASGEGRRVKEASEQVSRLMDGQQPVNSLSRAFAELQIAASALGALSSNSFFDKHLSMLATRANDGDRTPLGQILKDTVGSVTQYIDEYEKKPIPTATVAAQILEVTPPQKVGPIEFVFRDGMLRIQQIASSPADADRHNVEQAREALLEIGGSLYAELASSNADRRILETLSDLQTRIRSGANVIALGVANIACQLVFATCEDELAPAVVARLQAYSINLGMFVGQFPEWIRYSENAAIAEYSPQDIDAIHSAGRDLADNLKSAAETVDPEIPRTIRWMVAAIKNPSMAAKRSVFAAIRTIENFVSVVFKTFGELLGSVKDGAKKGTVVAVSGVVVVALLTAAVNVAKSVSPTAARVIQTTWLSKAADLVLKAMPEVK